MGYELVVKVRKKELQGKGIEYSNHINLNDANLLALVIQDLIIQFNLPFWKAVALVKQEKDKIFPFAP